MIRLLLWQNQESIKLLVFQWNIFQGAKLTQIFRNCKKISDRYYSISGIWNRIFSAVSYSCCSIIYLFFAVFKHHLPVDPHMEMGCQEQEVKLKYSAIALEKIVMLHPVVHLQLMILTGEYLPIIWELKVETLFKNIILLMNKIEFTKTSINFGIKI